MQSLQQELESLRAAAPSLSRRLDDFDKLGLRDLEQISSFAREELLRAANLSGTRPTINEIARYRVVTLICELLENMASRVKEFDEKPAAPKGE
jgi:hypothetical protein